MRSMVRMHFVSSTSSHWITGLEGKLLTELNTFDQLTSGWREERREPAAVGAHPKREADVRVF